MNEQQFSELRPYFEATGSCIDNGYRPLGSLISNQWIEEVVAGCWTITPKGQRVFQAIVDGKAVLR